MAYPHGSTVPIALPKQADRTAGDPGKYESKAKGVRPETSLTP